MSDTPHLDRVLALAGGDDRIPLRQRVVSAVTGQEGPVAFRNRMAQEDQAFRQKLDRMLETLNEPEGRTRDYERYERGREEHVSGHMATLQHGLEHPPLGMLRPASWSLLGTDAMAHREMVDATPEVRSRIHGHLESAAEAIRAGDRHRTIDHLAAARDVAMYHSDGRRIPALMREHIAALSRDRGMP